MEKRFKVVAKGLVMDAEINCNDYAYDAMHYYKEFIKSGWYSRVFSVDNETGELYNTYDKELVAGGVEIRVWSKL